jgi:hypothetical protein
MVLPSVVTVVNCATNIRSRSGVWDCRARQKQASQYSNTSSEPMPALREQGGTL